MGLSPASSRGGFSGGSIPTPIVIRTANDLVPALSLANDAWDTDPTDPVLDIYADDNGNAELVMHSSGKTLVVNAGATKYKGMTGAPADAVLGASEFALWLDATNGAAKLMVKAKQADGTVRTAAVNLA